MYEVLVYDYLKGCNSKLAVFKAKFLARLCYYFKIYRQNGSIRLTKKMLDLLILKSSTIDWDCMRYLPIIIYTKPPISNDSPLVLTKNHPKIVIWIIQAFKSSKNLKLLHRSYSVQEFISYKSSNHSRIQIEFRYSKVYI